MFFGGLPPGFEDAFGGGGMPGGMPGMGGGRRRGPVDNSKHYEVRHRLAPRDHRQRVQTHIHRMR